MTTTKLEKALPPMLPWTPVVVFWHETDTGRRGRGDVVTYAEAAPVVKAIAKLYPRTIHWIIPAFL